MTEKPLIVRSIGESRLTAGLQSSGRMSYAAHLAVHGPPPGPSLSSLIALAGSVDLRGRGGAAFPVARKLRSLAGSQAKGRRAPVVVVNAMEGEPGSAKDAMLLTRLPHLVLDGALMAAAALSAHEVVVGVPAGTPVERSVRKAVKERGAAVRVTGLPERFISGESRALVRGIRGEPALPPADQTPPRVSGVDRRPTLVSNTETYAQLAVLARIGPAAYGAGTLLLTVGGRAVVEAPKGGTLAGVLDACGAEVGDGVLLGGYHGRWVPSAAGVTLSDEGIVLPVGPGTCSFGEVARVAAWLGRESSGQCGPCRMGLPRLARELADGAPPDVLRKLAGGVQGACKHPDGTARFVVTALDALAAEFEAHTARGGCGRPVRGDLPVPDDRLRLHVDWVRCDAHGLCAALAPELVRLDATGHPVETGVPVPPWLRRKARRAVGMCPNLALYLKKE